MKKLIIIGASGHGKAVADIALKNEYKITGFLDDNREIKEILGFPVLGTITDAWKYQDMAEFIVAIGSNRIRKRITESCELNWATLVHPTAVIGMDVRIGRGSVVMANAVINPSTKIGKHCIINTGAIIEHDNVLADYVHVSPNAALAGTVSVGETTWIGIGASVSNNINICADCIVGAGAVVSKNIYKAGTYVGIPARELVKG